MATVGNPNIVVVTDTNVAAMPFDFDPEKMNYTYRLDENNKGPFAFMLPFDELIDPQKEQDCIWSIARQCNNIPYRRVRDVFLSNTAYSVMTAIIIEAGKTSENTMAFLECLDKLVKGPTTGYTKAEQEIVNNLQREAPFIFRDGATGNDAIISYASNKGLTNEESVAELFDIMTNFGTRNVDTVRDKSVHALEVGREARSIACKNLLEGFSEVPTKLVFASNNGNQDRIEQVLKEFLQGQYKNRYSKLDTLLNNIIKYAAEYNIKQPASNSTAKAITGYGFDEARTARTLFFSPVESAEKHYRQLLAVAKVKNIEIGNRVSEEQRQCVDMALSLCPSYIAKCANTSGIAVAIINSDQDINNITPTPQQPIENAFIAGEAVFNTAYVLSDQLNNTITLPEEIIHLVEAGFSLQDHWKLAISRNVHNPSAAYKYIAGNNDLHSAHKPNAALFSSKELPSPEGAKDSSPFTEAIPDIYLIYNALRNALAQPDTSVNISGRFGIGQTKYVHGDELKLLKDALPDAMALLEGPPQGMQLIQHTRRGKEYGRVEAIPEGIPIPSGTIPVMSLREYCDLRDAGLDSHLSMLRAQKQAKERKIATTDIKPASHHDIPVSLPPSERKDTFLGY